MAKSKTFLFAYALCTSALILGSTELGVRQLRLAPSYETGPGHFVSDPILPFRPRPSLISVTSNSEFSYEVRHNSLGFRDEEHPIQKPANTFRILALGDSFTYGVGVSYESTFLRVLEQMLNGRSNNGSVRFEVLKMGVSRYFPEAERLLLEHYGMGYEPDLIVLAFVPNDVVDTSEGIGGITVSSDGHLLSREAASLGETGMWIYRNSHLGRILIGALTEKVGSMRHSKIWDEIYQPDGFHESDWKKVEFEYLRIRALAEQLKAKLLLINIPMRNDVDGGPKTRYPSQRLEAFSARYGIVYVDISPAMSEARNQSSAPLYWEKDGHCTSAGYRVIAEGVFSSLIRGNLIPH